MRESTLPRTTPSLASMRWIVGTERVLARSAVLPLIDVQEGRRAGRPGVDWPVINEPGFSQI